MGLPSDRITTEIEASLRSSFNMAMQDMWDQGPWIEICPPGEARFVGNRLTYPNDTSKTLFWTNTALAITPNATYNPSDGKLSASRMLETGATSAHKIVQSVGSFVPSTVYTGSFYIRPAGRTFVQISIYDGSSTFSAWFNLSAASVVSSSGADSTGIQTQPNGFYLCTIGFTTSSAATASGTYTISLSPNGSTTSYAGDTTKGVYLWGNLIQQIHSPSSNAGTSPSMSGGNSYSAYTNNSGDTTIVPTSGNEWVDLTIGGSARTSNIILSASGRSAGDRLTIICELPATGSIFLDFRNDTAGGTELLPVITYPSHLLETPGIAMTGTLNFGFNGMAWVFLDGTIPS